MHKYKKYPNGLELITVPSRGTKAATIIIMVATGSKYENKSNRGLSHFLEHMFFKGTKKRPFSHLIVSELDSLGCEYNAFTSKEYTGYFIKVSAEKLESASEILSDMFFYSRFDQDEINKEKGVIIEELNMYLDNPMSYVQELFEELLYGDTPAGWDTIGTKEIISSLRQKDFFGYCNSQYAAKNTIIAFTGNVTEKNSKRLIDKYFSEQAFRLRNGVFTEKDIVRETQNRPAVFVKYKKTDQAHLSLGARAFPSGHAYENTLKMIALILGGSMSSRLFMNLRERRGLAYYVHTADEIYSDTGYLTTQAGVPLNKADQAIAVILEEYADMKKKNIGKAELNKVRDMLVGRYALEMESSENIATWYAKQAVMLKTVKRSQRGLSGGKQRLISPDEYLKELQAVDAKMIRKVANKIFTNERLNFAIIGPYQDGDKFQKLLKI
jgi:predicted Zn-dependent peptidase